MESKYCVLFAMGDVLVDTGVQYRAIWKHIGDKYGAETDYLEDAVKEKNIHLILAKYFSHLTESEKQNLVNELQDAEAKMPLQEIPGATKFLKELKDNGIKTGLVTSFNKKQTDAIFKQTTFKGLLDTVVTSDDVSKTKPNPEGFLKAANNLGYEPKDSFVFEDSFTGIEAAKKAGMRVVALSTTNLPQALKNVASKVIPDFTDFSVSDLNELYHGSNKAPVKKKGNNSWAIIILLLLVLAALFFLWKSCNDSRSEKTDYAINDASVTIESAEGGRSVITEPVVSVEKVSAEVQLPDGTKLNAFKNGMEEKIVMFLNSDEYKNAKEDNLKNKWFDFDNIEFIHGSSTELTKESYPQLDNLAAILKHYKNTKIKVGGYTDKTGTSEVNKKISQERANTIKSYLVNKGLKADNISAEGYGDEFAKYSADAPDSERALDRKISLRFVK